MPRGPRADLLTNAHRTRFSVFPPTATVTTRMQICSVINALHSGARISLTSISRDQSTSLVRLKSGKPQWWTEREFSNNFSYYSRSSFRSPYRCTRFIPCFIFAISFVRFNLRRMMNGTVKKMKSDNDGRKADLFGVETLVTFDYDLDSLTRSTGTSINLFSTYLSFTRL